jgi:hypothetical protein
MNALMLMTGSGTLLVLSSHESPEDPVFLSKLKAKGIEKFIAFDLPLDKVQQRYGGHYQVVMNDLHESDDLRVLDYNGHRVFELFDFDEIGPAVKHQPGKEPSKVFVD